MGVSGRGGASDHGTKTRDRAVNDLTVAGLVYDIIGVCILAVALMAPRTRHLYLHAGTYYGGNKGLFRVFLLQRTDARFGLPIVVVGFVLQVGGALPLAVPQDMIWPLLLPLAIALVAYRFVRRWDSRRSDHLYDDLRREGEATEE